MEDRKLTMLGAVLLAVTVLLYYVIDEWQVLSYITGVAMIAVLGIVFFRLNKKHLGSSGKR